MSQPSIRDNRGPRHERGHRLVLGRGIRVVRRASPPVLKRATINAWCCRVIGGVRPLQIDRAAVARPLEPETLGRRVAMALLGVRRLWPEPNVKTEQMVKVVRQDNRDVNLPPERVPYRAHIGPDAV